MQFLTHYICVCPTVDRNVLSGGRADDSVGFIFTASLMLHILLPPPLCYSRSHPRKTPLYSELLRSQSLRSEEAREETRMSLADAILDRSTVSEFCRDDIVNIQLSASRLLLYDNNTTLIVRYKNMSFVITSFHKSADNVVLCNRRFNFARSIIDYVTCYFFAIFARTTLCLEFVRVEIVRRMKIHARGLRTHAE